MKQKIIDIFKENFDFESDAEIISPRWLEENIEPDWILENISDDWLGLNMTPEWIIKNMKHSSIESMTPEWIKKNMTPEWMFDWMGIVWLRKYCSDYFLNDNPVCNKEKFLADYNKAKQDTDLFKFLTIEISREDADEVFI